MLKMTHAAVLAALTVSAGTLSTAPAMADGFNPMNMMNPGKWFGNKDDRPEGYPPPPPPGPGGPWGGPYSQPGYGPPMAPGYGPQGPVRGYGAAPETGDIPGAPAGPTYGAPGYGARTPAYAPPAAGYGAPANRGYGGPSYSTPSPSGYTRSQSASDSPSRAEMENRIQELEQRLQEMEANSRSMPPAPEPSSPPPSTYPYYTGDQTPSSSEYPFRPLNLGK